MNRLWTPWRSKYITETRDKGQCIFCDAVQNRNDAETFVLYRGEQTFIILNRYPYTSGHLMIAPYVHASRLGQCSPETTQEMMELLRRAETVLEEVYKPGGINLGMNLGEAAGAGIEQHIHMHVLPRWSGDANFMTSVGETRIIPELLEDTYARLMGKFERP
jgi:ATP adenylyltransferase